MTTNSEAEWVRGNAGEMHQQEIKNPHDILDRISDLDRNIQEFQAQRRSLIQTYSELMVGYEKHQNEVLGVHDLTAEPSQVNGMRPGDEGFGKPRFGF